MVKGNGFYHINEYSLLLPSKRSEKPIESNEIQASYLFALPFEVTSVIFDNYQRKSNEDSTSHIQL